MMTQQDSGNRQTQERLALAHLMVAMRQFLNDMDNIDCNASCSAECAQVIVSIQNVNDLIESTLKSLDSRH